MEDMQGTSFEDEMQLRRIRESVEEEEPQEEDVGEFLSKGELDGEEMDEFFLGDETEEIPEYREEF